MRYLPVGLGDSAPSSDPSCQSISPDASASDLEALAKRCGVPAVAQAIYDQTGYDIRQDMDTSGHILWQRVVVHIGGKAVGEATGTHVDVTNIIDNNGKINARNVVKDIGAIAAAAICTAYGAGAAAPVCAFVGGLVGGALYDLGKAVVHLFSGSHSYAAKPNNDVTIAAVQDWYAQNRADYAANVYALRSIAILIASMVDQARNDWNKHTGESLTWRAMYDKMLAHGLQVPPDWASQLGYPGALTDTYEPNGEQVWQPQNPVFHGQIVVTSLIELPEWAIAYGVFGKPEVVSRYDSASFQKYELGGIKKIYPQTSDLFEVDFATVSGGNVTSPSTVVDVSDKRKTTDEDHIVVDHDHSYVRVDYSPDQSFLVTNSDPEFQKATRAVWLKSIEPALQGVAQEMLAYKANQGKSPLVTVAVVGGLATLAWYGVKTWLKSRPGAGTSGRASPPRVVHPQNPALLPPLGHGFERARR